MINVERLTKTFGDEKAVDDITFQVPSGEVLGFLGPNGAGKSTTMRVLTCFLPASKGTVTIDGLDVETDSLEIRQRIGYLPETTPLYPEMTVTDYLRFIASMRGMEPSDQKRSIDWVTDVCGLDTVPRKRIDTLSKGFRQRVGLAQAMLHNPPILILDEPTSGLDPNQIVEIRELIRSLGSEKTVILSTHILPEVQASCDRVLIINRGKLVADGTPDSLQASFRGGQRILLGLSGPHDGLTEKLQGSGLARIVDTRTENGSTTYSLVAESSEDVRPDLFRMAVDNGWTLTELHREQASLEDVFRQLTAE
jgi:ABC-2 type transport system ATP-binding protein